MSGHDSDEDEAEGSEDDPSDLIGDSETTEEFEDWAGGDLEAAYLKAMSALEASDSVIPLDAPADELSELESEAKHVELPPVPSRETLLSGTHDKKAAATVADLQPKSTAEEPATLPQVQSTESAPKPVPVGEVPPTPRQIIEACLFVGGDALTATRLAGVLRGDFKSDFVDHEIDELNRLYAAECRPYEIRLGEGGYRLALREEFERIRHKVYGLGPKEVRLSQEALEVLAVVAYHQPIKQARVEELGKPGCGAVLRQLVRRELLSVERDPAQPRDVNYKTTARFLSLFGIGSLDELPRSEQVTYK